MSTIETRTYEYHSPNEGELAGVLGLTPRAIALRISYSRGGYTISYRFRPSAHGFRPWPGLRGKRTLSTPPEIWPALERRASIGARIADAT